MKNYSINSNNKLSVNEKFSTKKTIIEKVPKIVYENVSREVELTIPEVWNNIVNEISARNILDMSMACCSNNYPTGVNGNLLYTKQNDIRLLKRSRSICFCKWNEYTVFEMQISNIEDISLEKTSSYNKVETYDLKFRESNGIHWKFVLKISTNRV